MIPARSAGLSWREPGPVLLTPDLPGILWLDIAGVNVDAVDVEIAGAPGDVAIDAIRRDTNAIAVSLSAGPARADGGGGTLRASATIDGKRHECVLDVMIARFVLLNPADPVREVICAAAIEAAGFRRSLRRALADTGVGVTTVGNPLRSRFDYWTRDAFASGRFVAPVAGRAALHGLRAGSTRIDAGPLDRACSTLLHRRGVASLRIAQPRTGARWADWFGNIVMTPPLVATPQGTFPYGRALIGRQREVSLSGGVKDFMAAQGLQWPPVEIDTGWLYIGHADEVVNFVDTARGFRALLASPSAGLNLIDQLATSPVADRALTSGWAGRRVTARRLSGDPDVRQENEAAARTVHAIARQLVDECGWDPDAIVRLPILVRRRRPVWPNPVNGLAIGRRYLVPDPRGPRRGGRERLRAAIAQPLAAAGIEARFIDTFFPLHVGGGEIHCATNGI